MRELGPVHGVPTREQRRDRQRQDVEGKSADEVAVEKGEGEDKSRR